MICYKCSKLIEKSPMQHGLHEACFREWFLLEELADFSDVSIKSVGSGEKKRTSEFTKNTSFFHGKFKKYSASLSGISYILKVKDPNYPELPGTEYLCNLLAREVKIDVPEFYFIRFEGQLDTFVTRNFMQDHAAANLIHIYHFLEKNTDLNCEKLIKVLEEKTGRLADIERFVELCLFDALIGNNDRHGRNLALIQTKKGFSLAPFYDNPSYVGIEEEAMLGAQLEPSGSIATADTNEPKMQDYIVEFKRLGYEDLIKNFTEKVRIQTLFDLINSAFISDRRKIGMKKLMERRYKELVQ